MTTDEVRDALARSSSLDAFTRCRTTGCEVMVHLAAGAEPMCHIHGGSSDQQEYLTSVSDGAFIWVRHMTMLGPSDCE